MAKNKLAPGIAKVIQHEVDKRVAVDRALFGNLAVKLITSASMVVLHDEFKFGPQRLNKYQKLVEEQCECITGEFCSLEDIQRLADELAKKVKLDDVSEDESEF